VSLREIWTDRLVLRAVDPGDAADLCRALWVNRDHLSPWIDVPETAVDVGVMRTHLTTLAQRFASGTRLLYTVRDRASNELFGCAGIAPDDWSLSYWLVQSHTRCGYAREAVTALIQLAFLHPWASHLRIECRSENVRSSAVARALGFARLGARDGVEEWVLRRDRWCAAMVSNTKEKSHGQKGLRPEFAAQD
jgi:ribosomal-protein-serine acetyltransferase